MHPRAGESAVHQVNAESRDGGGRVLIYEQGSTGDVFVVPDPQLRLDQLETVQNEVAELLAAAATPEKMEAS